MKADQGWLPKPTGRVIREPDRGCFFCHVALNGWHADDCLYRGKVTEDHE